MGAAMTERDDKSRSIEDVLDDDDRDELDEAHKRVEDNDPSGPSDADGRRDSPPKGARASVRV